MPVRNCQNKRTQGTRQFSVLLAIFTGFNQDPEQLLFQQALVTLVTISGMTTALLTYSFPNPITTAIIMRSRYLHTLLYHHDRIAGGATSSIYSRVIARPAQDGDQ